MNEPMKELYGDSYTSAEIRFQTIEDADLYTKGDFSKGIGPEDVRYEHCRYELGFFVSPGSFKRAIPDVPDPLEGVSRSFQGLDTPKPKESLKGAEIL